MKPNSPISGIATHASDSGAEKISPSEKVRRLLDLPPPVQFQTEWAKFYAAEKVAAPPIKHSIVIFRLGGEWLALPTRVFQEIAERSPIHTLPHQKRNGVLGLVRVRGELLIAVSLAALLGIENTSSPAEKRTVRFIVLNQERNRFVFPADEVYGVHRLTGDLSPVPATVAHASATYTRGLFQWQDKTVGFLDDQLVFHSLTRSLA